MQSLSTRFIPAFCASFLALAIVACGGKQEAKTPSLESASVADVGSSAPDPSASPTSDSADSAAKPGADDGSDIIPPFPSSHPSSKATKKARAPKKKGGAKPKSKG